MAQKKQSESIIDSVYDFIFSEAKKTPDKVTPVEVGDLDTSNPYVDVIAAVLEQPLMYVNETTEEAIKGAADLGLNKFEVIADGKGGDTSVRLSVSEIPDLLNNDLTLTKKAFDKLEAARKAGRMTAWGKDLAAFTAAGMASQLGLDADTRDTFLRMGKSAEDESAVHEANTRSIQLAAQSWGKGNYQNISEADLKSVYGDKEGGEVYTNLQSIHQKYKAEMAKPQDQRDFSHVFSEAGNRDMHLLFEKVTLARKAAKARNNATKFAPDSAQASRFNRQAQGYDDAQNILGVLHNSDRYSKVGGVEKFLMRREVDLGKLRKELESLSKATDQASRERVKAIGVKIKEINTQVRSFKLQRTAYNLGVMETQIRSVQQLYEHTVGGRVVPAIMNGDFFDAKKNTMWDLQPRDMDRTMRLTYLDRSGKLVATEYRGFLAKKGKNRFQQAYYDGMMDFYYRFAPMGIIENITTGHGYARQAYNQRESFIENFRVFSGGKLTGKIDWDKLFSAEGVAYLHSLENDPNFAILLKFIEDNRGQLEKFNRLTATANQFNLIEKIKKEITESSLYKKTVGKLGGIVAKKIRDILLKLAKDEVAKSTVKNWFAQGANMKGVSIAVASTLKSFLTGASSAVGLFVDRMTDLARRIARPLMKDLTFVVSFALVSIVGIVIPTILLLSPFGTMKTLGSYSHVAPYEIVLGDIDYVVPVDGPGFYDGPGGTVPGGDIPLYSGGAYDIFMSIASEFGVSVTLHDCAGSTEGYCGRILGGWCYAAQGTVFCEMSRIPASAYNTIFRHEMMHFVQGWYFDYHTDIKYREWGADYMSNNGGWYCVVVNGVSMRATSAAEVFKREGGCTEEDLINLAYRRVDSADPQCAAYFHSRLESAQTGYCN
ncbi:MAG TPA: hypothetical protein VJY47_03985 [Candidatus Dojkabacteria bacterium]|nr:hypothetical protein [Candidatus Dojkabacteria bacterium]